MNFEVLVEYKNGHVWKSNDLESDTIAKFLALKKVDELLLWQEINLFKPWANFLRKIKLFK